MQGKLLRLGSGRRGAFSVRTLLPGPPMKAQLQLRPGRLTIPGFTDVIVSRLAEPFDIIMEWTRYVPLEQLLRLTPSATMPWEDDHSTGLTYIRSDQLPDLCIPKSLHVKTNNYLDRSAALYLKSFIAMFVQDSGAITPKDVFEAVFSAIRGLKP